MNPTDTAFLRYTFILFLIAIGSYAQENYNTAAILNIEDITKNTTKEELIKRYGINNIKNDKICIEEDMYEIGTKLFCDSTDELLIIWKDTVSFSKPKHIFIRKQQTNWRLNNNITTGVDLKTLEKLNQSPFCIVGFGWGFSGTVIDWNGGVLEKVFSTYDSVTIRLSPDTNMMDIPTLFIGDTEINSSHPFIQTLNPQAYEIVLSF
ncbi:hypothetical protein [Aquimarina addita]